MSEGPAQLNASRVEPMRRTIQRQLRDTDGMFRVLEIGSWAGESAILWASAIEASGRPGFVVCVDPWESYFRGADLGNGIVAEMDRLARSDAIFPVFTRNIQAAGLSRRVVAIRLRSETALPLLRRESFDLVYVDGSHAYSDVLSDLIHAAPLVRDGGCLCGDDLEIQRSALSDSDVFACMENRERDTINLSGGYLHPGVTLAINEVFGATVHCDNGFWSLRRSGSDWGPL